MTNEGILKEVLKYAELKKDLMIGEDKLRYWKIRGIDKNIVDKIEKAITLIREDCERQIIEEMNQTQRLVEEAQEAERKRILELIDKRILANKQNYERGLTPDGYDEFVNRLEELKQRIEEKQK